MQKWKSSRTQVTGCFSTLSPTCSGIASFVPLRPPSPGFRIWSRLIERSKKCIVRTGQYQLINCGIVSSCFLPWKIDPFLSSIHQRRGPLMSIGSIWWEDNNPIAPRAIQLLWIESSPRKSGDTRSWMESRRRISAHQCLSFQRMKGRLEVFWILEVIESRGQGEVGFLSKCICSTLGPFRKRRARCSNVLKLWLWPRPK